MNASVTQTAVSFACHNDWLYGVISRPEPSAALKTTSARGVLVVVGGPQYRIGSHRQFALLANDLAAQGIAVMRFDYRGMGDSEGEPRSFEQVDDDLRAACDCFMAQVPTLHEIVIWGLCDGASAALFYAHRDPRVTALVLLNPWVRTSDGEAKAYLKHYYFKRALSPALWRKLLAGEFDFRGALSGFVDKARAAGGNRTIADTGAAASLNVSLATVTNDGTLPVRMQDGFTRFKGRVLLIMSGNDLTAKEFSDLVRGSVAWKKLLAAPHVRQWELKDANHTFSRDSWRREVANQTAEWVGSW